MADNAERKLKFHVFGDERFIDLNLYQFGQEQCKPLHSFGPYVRNHYLFHYVLSGKGLLLANDQQYTVHSGQGFLIFPEQVTSYTADQDDPWEYIWVEFDGLRVRECLTQAGLSISHPVWQAANLESSSLLRDKMQKLVDLAEFSSYSPKISNTKARSLRMIGYSFLFLDQLIQSSAHKDSGSNRRLRDFYIKEALSFIEQNYQKDVSVVDIAAMCGLSRNYFGKVFKEGMGESPQQFLMHYRMAKASQLLKESKLSVRQIGALVNYPNQLHFSRAFKSVYGIAPREYRQKYFVDDNIT